jgi:RNA polymerase sigma-70 factor (ECF subfamily)
VADQDLIAFCRAEHARLIGLLTLHVRDVHVAEELAQDTLVRLCEHWPRVREMERPRAWLATVATNLARSAMRRRAAEQRAATRHGVLPDAIPHTDTAMAMAVRDAVAGLPERQRTAIAYRYFAGMSTAETAQAMRVAEGTIRALAAQGVANLRAAGLDVDDDAEVTHADA